MLFKCTKKSQKAEEKKSQANFKKSQIKNPHSFQIIDNFYLNT